ncbi:hypothetical protein JCM10207_007484 [Rhodosporidiobolus poonsookiae]
MLRTACALLSLARTVSVAADPLELRRAFPHLPGLYGWVEVDGKPLEVYSVDESEGKSTAFVEVAEGKQFKVCYRDERTGPVAHPFNLRLFIDGGSLTQIEPFVFGNLRLTDDDDAACTDENVIKNLGSIQLVYRRVKHLKDGGNVVQQKSAQQAIHERSKKANPSHMASFGAPVAASSNNRLTFNWLDTEPYSVVRFNYRSRQLLQIDGHIPDSPAHSPRASPSPGPAGSPAAPVAGPSQPRRRSAGAGASGSPDPAAAARIAALEAELALLRESQGQGLGQVKRERGEADIDLIADERRIKREKVEEIEREKEKNRKKGKKAEVIDLCDSD